jgi:hypothetical protein
MLTNEQRTGIPISQPDRQDIVDLYNRLRAAEAKLIGLDGKARLLPADLSVFLTQVLGDLKAGKSVTILEDNAELTTMKAARMLAVSRQFLVQLLEQGRFLFIRQGRTGGCMRGTCWPTRSGGMRRAVKRWMSWSWQSGKMERMMPYQ